MEPDLPGRSEEEVQAIKEVLEIRRKVQVGRTLLEKMESAVEESRYRVSESLIDLEKKLRGR